MKRPKIVTSYVNSMPTQKKNIVPKHLMTFGGTLAIALTIHVRITCICCCPVQIFAIDLRLFTLQNMHLTQGRCLLNTKRTTRKKQIFARATGIPEEKSG